ncbi:MAG TPA: DUF3089 domain-containing protein [Flavitalea sp.]|nr:DUF3089 domain-containing protein [Flavitalea sp.]
MNLLSCAAMHFSRTDFFPVLAILMLTACSTSRRSTTEAIVPSPGSPRYDLLDSWAAHPMKQDPSDQLPVALKGDSAVDSSVVVFFIHPTTFTADERKEWNAELSDNMINKKTDEKPILYQASAFNDYPIYAPRYRQAHIRAYFTEDTARAKAAFDLAYSDVKNAFVKFLEEAHGRPFILASHSQGTTHAIRLLKEFVDSTRLQKQMVAAYIIGMQIPDNFKTLRMCEDSAATGCLVGWRTYREGYIPDYVDHEAGKPMITNPLTWTVLDEQEAPATLNKGAIVTKFDKVYNNAADARIHDRVLWVSQLNFPGSFLVRKKNLHIGDINLFWMNIRENCKTRVRSYRNGIFGMGSMP